MNDKDVKRLMQKAAIKRKENLPKRVNLFCKCGNQLTEVNVFFGKDSCSDCQSLHLLHQDKNKWKAKDMENDLPF